MSVVASRVARRLLVAGCATALAVSTLVAGVLPSSAAAAVPAAALPALSALSALSALPAGPSLSSAPDSSFWGTNGRVTDIVSDGTSAYLAGAFDFVGPTTGRGTLVDSSAGTRLSSDAIRADGPVWAAADDDAGGYYLGGSFARIGTTRRNGIAHVLADGSLDPGFDPALVGDVRALAVVAGRLVVGGTLTSAGGLPAGGLVALAPDGSRVAGWVGTTDGFVSTLRVVADRLYVGGTFARVDGVAHANLARLVVVDGSLDAEFAATASAGVRSVGVAPGVTRDLDTVYAGGDFTTVTAQGLVRSHARLVALTGAGRDLGWTASAPAPVTSVAVSPDRATILVGGGFTSLNGAARVRVGRLTTTGTLTSFDARLDGCFAPHVTQYTNQFTPCWGEVNSVGWSPGGETMYVGGVFTSAQGQLRHNAAAFSSASGALTTWVPAPSARVRVITPVTRGLALGGDFTSVNGTYRRGLAKISLSTGRADPAWRADTDNIVLDLDFNTSKTYLFAAGAFTRVAGQPRMGVAAVTTANATLSPTFTTPVNKPVLSIAVRGSYAYLGGLFTAVGSVARSHAARVSVVSGLADGWVANTVGTGATQRDGGAVTSLAVTSNASRVFLAGGFTAVNNVPTWGGIIAVTGATGAVLGSRLGGVQRCGDTYGINRIHLSGDDRRLYGGDLCPDSIYQWDAVNLATTKPAGLNWMTLCNGGMQGRLEAGGHFYYGTHGGDVGQGGWCYTAPNDPTHLVQQRAFAFSATDGAALDWAPTFDSPMGVWAYAAVPQGLLVGGDFTLAGDRSQVQQGLALFRGTP